MELWTLWDRLDLTQSLGWHFAVEEVRRATELLMFESEWSTTDAV